MISDAPWQLFQESAIQYFIVFLICLTHVTIILSIIAASVMVVRMILVKNQGVDLLIAALAALSAILAYFLAKALGISIPEVVLHSVTEEPLKIPLFVVGFLIPGLAGTLSAFVINKAAEQHVDVFQRVIIFTTTLLILVFTDVYVVAVRQAHGFDKQLAPNGAFVLGLSMYWVLRGRKELPFGRYSKTASK